MRRKQRRDQDERIKIEKKPDGIAQFVVPLGLRLDKKEQKEQKEEALGYSAEILHRV
jgi:hypothetical protein